MPLHVDDATLVRAPANLVCRRLVDVAHWPEWWRGTRVRPLRHGDDTWAVELAGAPARRLRMTVRLGEWRPNVGFGMLVAGDVEGDAEFWLEPANGGTVVHHLLRGRATHRPSRSVLGDYRRAVRRGLWGVKDLLQLEARTSAGLEP